MNDGGQAVIGNVKSRMRRVDEQKRHKSRSMPIVPQAKNSAINPGQIVPWDASPWSLADKTS